jgi:hypothetical protein
MLTMPSCSGTGKYRHLMGARKQRVNCLVLGLKRVPLGKRFFSSLTKKYNPPRLLDISLGHGLY